MSGSVPLEARKIDHVYIKAPKDTIGLQSRDGTRLVVRCSLCGTERPKKDHFKTFVRKVNACSAGVPVEREEGAREYYRLAEFTPSRDQLIRYHNFLKRPLPLKWDKESKSRKVSFDEERMKGLIAKYPSDPLYSSILEFRSLDKLAGTYIGRVA